MTNPDNAGGLLPCPFCGVPVDFVSNRDWHRIQGEHEQSCPLADYEFATPATDQDRMSTRDAWNHRPELCRAAPAGGDAAKPVVIVDFDRWNASPYTAVLLKSIAEDYVPLDSAPAGSGEVEEMAETIYAAHSSQYLALELPEWPQVCGTTADHWRNIARAALRKTSPAKVEDENADNIESYAGALERMSLCNPRTADGFNLSHSARHIRDYAALLRKLQQGADKAPPCQWPNCPCDQPSKGCGPND